MQSGARYTLFETSIGVCGIAWRDDVVIATHLPEATPQLTAVTLARRAKASYGKPPAVISDAMTLMTGLLEGEKSDLSGIDCDFSQLGVFETKV